VAQSSSRPMCITDGDRSGNLRERINRREKDDPDRAPSSKNVGDGNWSLIRPRPRSTVADDGPLAVPLEIRIMASIRSSLDKGQVDLEEEGAPVKEKSNFLSSREGKIFFNQWMFSESLRSERRRRVTGVGFDERITGSWRRASASLSQ
jgi:hypothetical protein